jgi:hypothetical protein
MKQLQHYLALINQIVMDHLQHDMFPEGDAVRFQTSIDRLQIRASEFEGLTFEDIRVGLQDLVLPTAESKEIGLTFRLDNLVLHFASIFWTTAAAILRKSIITKAGHILDSISVEGVRVQVTLSPDKLLSVKVTMDRTNVMFGGSFDVRVENLVFFLGDFDLKEKDKKKALGQSKVILDRLEIYVTEALLKRTVDAFRDKIPSVVTALDFSLDNERMLVTAKTKLLPMAIPTELVFCTERNLFGIYIVKVLLGIARPLILKAVQWFAANRPEIEASGTRLYINPWAKIPVPIVCRLTKFAVENKEIVVAFEPLEPAPVELVAEEEPALDQPLPLLPVP